MRGVTVRRIGDGGVEGEPVSAGIAISGSPRGRVIGNDVSNDVKAFQADGVDVLDSPGSVVAAQPARAEQLERAGADRLGTQPDRAQHARRQREQRHRGQRGVGLRRGRGEPRARQRAVRHRGGLRPSCARRPQHRGEERDRLPVLRPPRQPDQREPRPGEPTTGSSSPAGSSAPTATASSATSPTGTTASGSPSSRTTRATRPATSLKGNTAKRNAGHGMDVVAGTIDKGGNRASGNATPRSA